MILIFNIFPSMASFFVNRIGPTFQNISLNINHHASHLIKSVLDFNQQLPFLFLLDFISSYF